MRPWAFEAADESIQSRRVTESTSSLSDGSKDQLSDLFAKPPPCSEDWRSSNQLRINAGKDILNYRFEELDNLFAIGEYQQQVSTGDI